MRISSLDAKFCSITLEMISMMGRARFPVEPVDFNDIHFSRKNSREGKREREGEGELCPI